MFKCGEFADMHMMFQLMLKGLVQPRVCQYIPRFVIQQHKLRFRIKILFLLQCSPITHSVFVLHAGNQLKDAGVALVVRSVANAALASLDVSRNEIGKVCVAMSRYCVAQSNYRVVIWCFPPYFSFFCAICPYICISGY